VQHRRQKVARTKRSGIPPAGLFGQLRVWTKCIIALLLFFVHGQACAFSILGHRIVAMRVLQAAQGNPSAYPPFLSRISHDKTLTAYYLGGTEAPDFGALCQIQKPNIQYSTHYNHPALWIKLLFENACDDNELAYAWGWVVHEAADLQIHPWMDANGLNFCEVGPLHAVFEFGIDASVGAGLAECKPYNTPSASIQSDRLLKQVHQQVSAAALHSATYDDYIRSVNQRCTSCRVEAVDPNSPVQTGEFDYFSVGMSSFSLDAFAVYEMAKGEELVRKPGVMDAIKAIGDTTTSPTVRAIATALIDSLESANAASCTTIGPTAASEVGQFYDVDSEKMRKTLLAAARHDWKQLDHNFDTNVQVNDPALAASSTAAALQIALVLDSSGSMHENDPNDLRKRAAELLIDRAPDDTRFTIVRFDQRFSVLADRDVDHDRLRQAIGAVGADGGTLICQAVNGTLDVLAGAGCGPKAIVLLTDGKSQDNCDAAGFAKYGVPIYTVGLSDEANGAMLQAIAAATGGSYVHARTATDVQGVFDIVASQATGQSSVADFTGTAKSGMTSDFHFILDATIQALSVLLTWPGSDLDLVLISPSGNRLAAKEAGRSAGTYELLRVDRPAPGTWTAIVKSIDVASSGEPFRLRASAVTPVRIALEPAISLGAAMKATLDGFPSVGQPRLNVRVQRPDGRVADLEVAQDGHAYLATYAHTDVPGAYTFAWSASVGDVSRFATRSVFVGAPNAQGGSVQSVEGQYVRWNRGSLYGLRTGLEVRIVHNGEQIATGHVIDVRLDDSDIELDTVSGLNDVVAGDTVEVEMSSWTGDSQP
jgi:Mg-chelatase subunit ChlD